MIWSLVWRIGGPRCSCGQLPLRGLVDSARRERRFYFLEMVHVFRSSASRWVTGIDLVREMVRVAAGEPLGYGRR